MTIHRSDILDALQGLLVMYHGNFDSRFDAVPRGEGDDRPPRTTEEVIEGTMKLLDDLTSGEDFQEAQDATHVHVANAEEVEEGKRYIINFKGALRESQLRRIKLEIWNRWYREDIVITNTDGVQVLELGKAEPRQPYEWDPTRPGFGYTSNT